MLMTLIRKEKYANMVRLMLKKTHLNINSYVTVMGYTNFYELTNKQNTKKNLIMSNFWACDINCALEHA